MKIVEINNKYNLTSNHIVPLDNGTDIEACNLKKGDVLLFRNNSGVSYVTVMDIQIHNYIKDKDKPTISIEDIKIYFNSKGLEHTVLNYFGEKMNCEDSNVNIMWSNAYNAIKELQTYIDTKYNEQKDSGII